MTTTTFRLKPIEPEDADLLRADGGHFYVADSNPGYPCRQCLRDADVGDELVLVSYDPFTMATPYRSAGPIFLHREPCSSPADLNRLPEQLTGRQLSVRAFDQRDMMIDAAIIDGATLKTTINTFFANDQSDKIHIHNASRGCWAVTVLRA